MIKYRTFINKKWMSKELDIKEIGLFVSSYNTIVMRENVGFPWSKWFGIRCL